MYNCTYLCIMHTRSICINESLLTVAIKSQTVRRWIIISLDLKVTTNSPKKCTILCIFKTNQIIECLCDWGTIRSSGVAR